MKQLFLAIAMMLVLGVPVWAQNEQVDDQITPALPGQQVFQQNQPLTIYSNKGQPTIFENNTGSDNFIVIPNTQIVIANTQPVSAMVFITIEGGSSFATLFVDNKVLALFWCFAILRIE